MTEPDAIQTMINHVQEMKSAFQEAEGDLKRAHSILETTAPVVGAMPWNSFRGRAVCVMRAWYAGRQEESEMVRDLEQEVDRLRAELEKARSETGKIQGGQIRSDIEIPRRLAGWSINQHARGYWRAFRKVAGKSRCVHLGKRFDRESALQKLEAKNKELQK